MQSHIPCPLTQGGETFRSQLIFLPDGGLQIAVLVEPVSPYADLSADDVGFLRRDGDTVRVGMGALPPVPPCPQIPLHNILRRRQGHQEPDIEIPKR